MVVQWLRIRLPVPEDTGSIPGPATKPVQHNHRATLQSLRSATRGHCNEPALCNERKPVHSHKELVCLNQQPAQPKIV